MLFCYFGFIALAAVLHSCFGADQLTPVDLFGTGDNEWYLAFRGTPYTGQSVYNAYLHGSENVDPACKQTTVDLPCASHYRSSILDDWKDIDEVAFVIYKYGKIQKYVIFDGSGTNSINWFTNDKLVRSSWSDLKGDPQIVSIQGDSALDRRFFLNHNYGGCDHDAGWFVVADRRDPACKWEEEEAYPMFLYATGDKYENWASGKTDEADMIAVYVKYGEPEVLDFVDLFGNGEREWRLVFRGTSHIKQKVYDAYFHGSQKVADACKQTNGDIPCSSHYRSTILDDWKNIAEVAFVIYKSGQMKKYATFDGTGTNNVNWFSDNKLRTSSWRDLKGHSELFSIKGDDGQERRFFINFDYDGCDKDIGWFIAVDEHGWHCGWEDTNTYPLFKYADSDTHENWTHGKIGEADVIAVFVKFGAPNPVIG